MKISENGLNIIKESEGLATLLPDGRITSYPDIGYGSKLYTIGYGNTRYEDGSKVKKGDIISEERASELLENITNGFAESVESLVKTRLNQNQFDALVSFIYNIGVGAFSKSTILRKINKNPNDTSIAHEFSRWKKSNGKILNGLVARRKKESDLYFTPTNLVGFPSLDDVSSDDLLKEIAKRLK